MSEDEALALMMALAAERPISVDEIGRTLTNLTAGDNPAQAGRILIRPLLAAGAVCRVHRGRYQITERGRIAAALLMAKDPSLEAAFFD